MKVQYLSTAIQHRPGVAIVDLRGEISAPTEDTLNAAYAEAEACQEDAILLKLDGVDYINSSGFALLIGLVARARKHHRRLLLCGMTPHYEELFRITRLADLMSIFPDEAIALAERPLSLPLTELSIWLPVRSA